MKLKLTVLGLCFLTTNVQWSVAQAPPAGVAATTAVRVVSGELQGLVDDGVESPRDEEYAWLNGSARPRRLVPLRRGRRRKIVCT